MVLILVFLGQIIVAMCGQDEVLRLAVVFGLRWRGKILVSLTVFEGSVIYKQGR